MLFQVLGNHDYGETNAALPDNCVPGLPCFFSPIHEARVLRAPAASHGSGRV